MPYPSDSGLHAGCSYRISLQYDSDYGRHRDDMFVRQEHIDAVIASLPGTMQKDLQAGMKIVPEEGAKTFDYVKGKVFSNEAAPLVHIPLQAFNRRPARQMHIEPRAGRFYPAGLFNSEKLPASSRMTPLRIVERTADQLLVDSSHPLSNYDLTLTLSCLDAEDAVTRQIYSKPARSPRSNQLPEFLGGPGMQLRFGNAATDFFSDNPFQRTDPGADSEFYSAPRLIDHLDTSALAQLRTLYSELIAADTVVLDIMSSTNSHLDDKLTLKKLTGLGMNREELSANPRLDEIVVHDINQQSRLPFADASFDIVVCSLSIEYLTEPLPVFAEIARIIRPGGRFIISFSNRWFPTKAIQAWSNLHDFERIGMVTEYFIESACYGPINTCSYRGHPRPLADRHSLPLADPIYAVWADRT